MCTLWTKKDEITHLTLWTGREDYIKIQCMDWEVEITHLTVWTGRDGYTYIYNIWTGKDEITHLTLWTATLDITFRCEII